MQEEFDDEILNYRNALITGNGNTNFETFLKSLNPLELKAYLYLESKRIECFLKELGLIDKNTQDTQPENDDRNQHILKTKSSHDFLIKFCYDCGTLPKPSTEIINILIKKHKLHFRKLTNEEIGFYLEC